MVEQENRKEIKIFWAARREKSSFCFAPSYKFVDLGPGCRAARAECTNGSSSEKGIGRFTLHVKLQVPKRFAASQEVCQAMKTPMLAAFPCFT